MRKRNQFGCGGLAGDLEVKVLYVKQYWPILKTQLLAGEYHPQGALTSDRLWDEPCTTQVTP